MNLGQVLGEEPSEGRLGVAAHAAPARATVVAGVLLLVGDAQENVDLLLALVELVQSRCRRGRAVGTDLLRHGKHVRRGARHWDLRLEGLVVEEDKLGLEDCRHHGADDGGRVDCRLHRRRRVAENGDAQRRRRRHRLDHCLWHRRQRLHATRLVQRARGQLARAGAAHEREAARLELLEHLVRERHKERPEGRNVPLRLELLELEEPLAQLAEVVRLHLAADQLARLEAPLDDLVHLRLAAERDAPAVARLDAAQLLVVPQPIGKGHVLRQRAVAPLVALARRKLQPDVREGLAQQLVLLKQAWQRLLVHRLNVRQQRTRRRGGAVDHRLEVRDLPVGRLGVRVRSHSPFHGPPA